MKTAFDPDDILHLPLMANLATRAADGSPRNAPVWFHWEDGALWMLGAVRNASVNRIAADPRVAVEIVDDENARGSTIRQAVSYGCSPRPPSPTT